jgi:ligand-binding sensor domain-containing protein/signal transduction histidine kinase
MVFNRIFSVILILAFVLTAQKAQGQPLNPNKDLSQYNLDHFNSNNIPASIFQIIQSKDGYLWMATLNGLTRFDGVKVTRFDKFSNPVLPTNGVKTVFEDNNKNLWVGTFGDGLFLKQQKSFKKFTIPFGKSSNNIENFFQDSNNNLWLCTLKGPILFKDSVFQLLTPVGFPSDVDITAFDATEDNQGNIWIASLQGMLKYANGELRVHQWEGDKISGEVLAVHVANNNDVWIASYGSGVYRVSNNICKKVSELSFLTRPLSIMEDRNNNLWFGSEQGITRYHKGQVSFLDTRKGLAHNHVTTICEDHEGSIWIGTYYGGLNRFRDGTFTNYTLANGLPHNTTHAIYQTKDNSIWVGTESGLAHYENGTFKTIPLPTSANVRVRDIHADSDNNLWVASYTGVFKIKGKTITRYSTSNGLPTDLTRVIYEDSKKNLWVGTRNGLCLYEEGKWKTYTEKNGLLNTFIMSILELRDGTLLIGTNSGLFWKNGNTFQSYKINKGTLGTLFRMYEDKDGYIWIGSNDGLLCIKDHNLYEFGQHKTLGNSIYQILEDKNNMLWLTSDVGIIRVPRKEVIQRTTDTTTVVNSQLFDKSSGLRTNEITATSNALIAANNTFWFPTLEGVAVINPENILINKVPPPIVIEKVLISGKQYDPSGTIIVPSGSRNIEIHYAALSFMIPQKVQYKYLLAGYDNTWYEAGDRRIAYYTSLPAGEYAFKLAASNNDSVWSSDEQSLKFIVLKPFWQSWIFYLMALTITGLFIFAMVDFRIRRIKKLNRILDDRIRERTREVLEQKAEIEAQRDDIEARNTELEKARNIIADQYAKLQEINENLEDKVEERTEELQKAYADLMHANEELDYFVYKSAHDIKGPLARLQGLCNLALMEATDDSSKEYLSILKKESVSANQVIQKLSHAHELKTLTVEPTPINITKLVSAIIQQLHELHIEAKSIAFTVTIEPDLTITTDRKLLQELLFNLLENSVVFSAKYEARVQVTASKLKDQITFTISDNGIGITDEKTRNDLFKMFVKGSEKSQGIGLGLYITKKTIEKLRGTIELKKSVPGETIFEVTLPA